MDRDEHKKKINLMPEDMRSKQIEHFSDKKKKDFQFDLVVPEGQKLSKVKGSDESFLAKISKIFKKPPRFGSSVKKPKAEKPPLLLKEVKKPKPEKKSKEHQANALHVPKQAKHSSYKIDYNKSSKDDLDFNILGLEDQKKDDIKKEKPKPEKKPSGPSFLDRLKKIFARKPKQPKLPKVERVMEKPIQPRSLNNQSKAEKPPLPLKEVKGPEIPPASQSQTDIKPQPEVVLGSSQAVAKEESKSDFVIPGLQAKKEEFKEEPKKEKKEKEKISKFHKPEPRIRARFLDEGGGVDLIPTAAKTRSWRQVINLIIISLVGSIVIMGIFYTILVMQSQNIKNRQSQEDQQISNLEEQMLSYDELNKEIHTLGDEIRLVQNILHRHIYWTNFFALLEKYTVAEVYYTGFSAGNSGALTLNAIGEDFEAVARQLKVLEQEEVKNTFVTEVDISSATLGSSGVEFAITLILDDSLFYYDDTPEEDIQPEE
ncbi:PilN domain-containing protein [bacterium]|nr:PilN domain-containing protein [bacterium]